MKKLLVIIAVSIIYSATVFSQDTIVVQGHYYGKNLYVINPTNKTDSSFCVKKVLVNNQPTKDELKSNSFEVDFSLLNIAIGKEVKILIIHDKACNPKVINKEVLQPQSTFAFVNAKIDKTGKIIWTVKGDLYSPFTVEQYRWKKWISLGDVDLTDTVKKNTYEYETKPHFGPNQFRVSHTDVKGIAVYSKIIKYRNPAIKEVMLASTKVTDEITFTGETAYELFDEKGTFIMDGFGTTINLSDLSKGKYWVNYDNKTELITKK